MSVAAIATGLGLLFAATAPADAPTLTVTGSDAVIGQPIHATAQLSESPDASGTISFELFDPGDPTCLGPALTPAPTSAPVSGEGPYASGDFTPDTVGTYHWRAHYSGDGVNPEADSNCSAVSTVAKASPALAGSAGSAIVGGTIDDEVTVTGGDSPTGEVTFSVYGPADTGCLTPLETSVMPIQAAHATSANFSTPGAGEFRWTASYPGDANNEAASTLCGDSGQTSTVGKASPTLAGLATATITAGASISDEATIAGGFSPGGNLVFRAFGPGDATCATPPKYEETVAISGNGSYSPPGFAPGPGLYRWTVSYAGDANNEAASTLCGASNQSSTVNKASPTLTGTATSTATVGLPIHDEATLSGGTSPTGEVTFSVYGPADGSCSTPLATSVVPIQSGHATSTDFSPQQIGEFRWTASYPGDANNEAASTACNAANQSSTVNKASPTLTGVATSNVTVGVAISDQATLAGSFAAGGNLVFRAYGPGDATCAALPKYEDTVPISGNGSYAPSGFAPGPGLYRWTVSYAGDANNEAASTACNAANQSSTVNKASPTLTGLATSTVTVGGTIHDNATLAGSFTAGGNLVFRAYGPSDGTCATAPKYEKTVAINGNGSYSPPGFAPVAPGLYRWTVSYAGDANNEAASTACDAPNQSSAVGTITLTLSDSATSGTVGTAVTATATLLEGAIPTGQITFKAFPPSDVSCSGPADFSSTVSVSGNGFYHSAAFLPSRVGTFRWTAAYSGDPNHNPAAAGCGTATSAVAKAVPSIAGQIKRRLTVGAPIRDTATLQGGYAPGGTIRFQIYGPGAKGCGKPLFVDTVAINGNGSFSSDPFVALRTGRYSFVATYSGDATNQAATEPCESVAQVAQVQKVSPKVEPRARLIGGNQISIRAHLSGAALPSGAIGFHLYGPGDRLCKRKPAFSGTLTAKKNGNYLLAEYLATRSGVYRLSVGYSGDARNRRYEGPCGAQSIRVR